MAEAYPKPRMNLASSDIFSERPRWRPDELGLDLLDAGHPLDDLTDLLLDQAHRAAHGREAVRDVHLGALDLGVVEQPELDDVHPELRILDHPERIEYLVTADHVAESAAALGATSVEALASRVALGPLLVVRGRVRSRHRASDGPPRGRQLLLRTQRPGSQSCERRNAFEQCE